MVLKEWVVHFNKFKKINMYGHDGLMGSNGPMGVGLLRN